MSDSGPIVACGGGRIGEPAAYDRARTPPGEAGTWPVDTEKIDAYTLTLAEKQAPDVLLIPTASENSQRHDLDLYIETFTQHWARLGAGSVDVLRLTPGTTRGLDHAARIWAADIVYVSGGDTRHLLDIWRKHQIGPSLRQASLSGTVLAGNSAGAVCWFERACPAPHHNGPEPVRGLGWHNIDICPHWNTQPERHNLFAQMLKPTGRHGVAVDNAAALIVNNGRYQVIADNQQAWVYLCSWHGGQFTTEPLDDDGPLADITNTAPTADGSGNGTWPSTTHPATAQPTTGRFDAPTVDWRGSHSTGPANN